MNRYFTAEHRENLRLAALRFYEKNPGFRKGQNVGRKVSSSSRKKMSIAQLGDKNPRYWLGKKRPELSKARKGEGNPNWQGGLSTGLYGNEFDERLKDRIRRRDSHKCQMPGCWKKQNELKRKLVVHHVDYNPNNNCDKNLLSLCPACHNKVGSNRGYWGPLLEELQSNGRKVGVFFTSDQHFWHSNIIKYCNRPFGSVEEMNEALITRYNSKVGKGDLVYLLGDFCWNHKGPEIVKKLNGFKVLILGSHDKKVYRLNGMFSKITPMEVVKFSKKSYSLNHYCMRVWYLSHYNQYHLYGHSHGKLEAAGKSLDVGVDSNGFQPWTEKEIIDYMATRPDNFNYVGDK